MAGRLGREDPLNADSWTGVLDELNDKNAMFEEEEVGDDGSDIFPIIKVVFDKLPHRQKEQFSLMVVMAPGVPITTEIMASLWDMVRAASLAQHRLRTMRSIFTQVLMKVFSDTLQIESALKLLRDCPGGRRCRRRCQGLGGQQSSLRDERRVHASRYHARIPATPHEDDTRRRSIGDIETDLVSLQAADYTPLHQ